MIRGRLLGMKPIKDVVTAYSVSVYDPEDTTLSGGEYVQAVAIVVLIEQWDGVQQRRLGDALAKSVLVTEEAQAWVRICLRFADWNEINMGSADLISQNKHHS